MAPVAVQGMSLADCAAPLAPVEVLKRGALTAVGGLKDLGKGDSLSVLRSPLSASQNLPQESYSYTESDLLSDNSFLKSTFPSLASSTQTDYFTNSPIQQRALLAGMMESTNSCLAGAGPHCPAPSSEGGVNADSSLVQRGSRARGSRMKVTGLRVLDQNYGGHVLAALRMVFKSYEPAVHLARKSLKGPTFGEDGVELERFAMRLMECGEVTRPEELSMLSDILHLTHDTLVKVLSCEADVRRNLPVQKAADYAPDGPVMTELRRVLEQVDSLEEELNGENDVLAAEFDEDSFQFQNSTSTDGVEGCGAVGLGSVALPPPAFAPSSILAPTTSTLAGVIPSTIAPMPPPASAQPPPNHINEKGEPVKKKSRLSVEEDGKSSTAECEEPSPVLSRSPSISSIGSLEEDVKKPSNQDLAAAGTAALLRVQK